MPAERHDTFLKYKNDCGQPVSFTFWRYSLTKISQKIVQPGETVVEEFGSDRHNWWMSSVCPVGYDPDPPFALENTRAIVESTYDCISKQVSWLR